MYNFTTHSTSIFHYSNQYFQFSLFLASHKKTPNAFPKKATELTAKEVRLLIEINKDNVVSKSKLFVATDAYESGVSYSGISSTSFTESNMNQDFFCLFIIY